MAELLQQTRKQVFDILLVNVLFVIEIDIRNPNVYIVLKSCAEMVDNNRCKNCLPGSRNSWTEQHLLVGLSPCIELRRVQEPLASPLLSPPNIVCLLRTIVNWREPVKDSLMLLVMLLRTKSIRNFLEFLIDS